jgi:hypothetical protein
MLEIEIEFDDLTYTYMMVPLLIKIDLGSILAGGIFQARHPPRFHSNIRQKGRNF